MRRTLLLSLVLSLAPPLAADFFFDRVAIAREGDNFVLNAQIRLELNETTLDALDNGVPLTIETHIQLRRDGAWIWEKDIVEHRIRQTLQLDPLSSLYEVRYLATGKVHRFATETAALSAMGEISDLVLVAAGDLRDGQDYEVELRSYLDVEALPLPLRPLALLSSDWGLESEVWQWQLRP